MFSKFQPKKKKKKKTIVTRTNVVITHNLVGVLLIRYLTITFMVNGSY